MEETTTPPAAGAPQSQSGPAPEATQPPIAATQAMSPENGTEPAAQTPAAPPSAQGGTPQAEGTTQPAEGGSKKWLIIAGAVVVVAGIAYILLS